MDDKPSVNVLVRDKFTKQLEGSFSLEEVTLVLSFRGKKRNLHNDLEQIERDINSKVPLIVLDLYNIALVAYVWDLQTPRPAFEPREFRVLMSVSNKDRWDNVKSHLEATLRFLTGDTFAFNFVQGKTADGEFQFQKKSDECVSLFSGGIDSLAGVKWMLDQKLKAILVSHPGMGLISGTQREIVAELLKMTGNGLTWHQVRAIAEPGSDLSGKEFTQFSRSFLYLTLGAIYAVSLGLEKEYIFENGILALNVPLTPSRAYSNTRTAHPHFVMMYEELLRLLFGSHVSIVNPFVGMTKGEVTKLLDATGFRDLVKVAMSCRDVTRLRYDGVATSQTRHCGICFPCVIRASINNANLWSSDASYAQDITAQFNDIPEEGRKLLFEMMDFARQIDKCSTVDDVFSEFPQFFIGEDVDPAVLFDMAKRHIDQFKDFLVQRCHQTLRQNLGLP